MSEESVLRIMKKRGGWLIVGELMTELGTSRREINRVLKILQGKGVIQFKVIYTRSGAKYVYRLKE